MPDRRPRHRRTSRVWILLIALLIPFVLAECGPGEKQVTIGLITKQETNPYWVTLREVAQRTADRNKITLVTAHGTSDVDVDSQRTALRQMIADRVDGILIAPNDSSALVPDIRAARDAGIIVIAVDTPVSPLDAVDAYYATDNTHAGELVGAYAAAKATGLGLDPQIAMLNLAPGIASGADRRAGFLTGFGITADAASLVASVDTLGDRQRGHDEMARLLAEHPGINVVYAVNEPVILGALAAIAEAGKDTSQMVIVSVDGGCAAMREAVRPGQIDATALQFPQNMARQGVLTIADAVRGGERPSGYLDTGTQLVSGSPVAGIESRGIEYGIRNCWG